MRTSPLLMLAALLPGAASCETLPAEFVANRVYLVPQTSAGAKVWFYLDSGGGDNMICRDTAERLGLAVRAVSEPNAEQELGKNLGRTEWPAFDKGKSIPVHKNAAGNTTLLVHDCRAEDSPRAFGDATAYFRCTKDCKSH